MRLDPNNIPKHIAIIMDGNRRWAVRRGLPTIAGHAYVVEKLVEELVEKCGELGVEYLTLWAFSTENWKRDQEEVNGIMNLFRQAIEKKADKFIEKGAKLKIIGDLSRFPTDIQEGMKRVVERSEKKEKLQVNLAINYGGRDEIVRGVNRFLSVEDRPRITEEMLEKYLDTAGIPDPELIIRAGGEMRLSGFMLWQAQYSELYFTKVLMPDFTPSELVKAIEEYQRRQRRFGK